MAVQDREGLHVPLRPMGTGYHDNSPALRAFETEVMQGRLRHGGAHMAAESLPQAPNLPVR